jgi:hypothetical protein
MNDGEDNNHAYRGHTYIAGEAAGRLALTAQRFGLIKSMAQMQKLLYSDDIQS